MNQTMQATRGAPPGAPIHHTAIETVGASGFERQVLGGQGPIAVEFMSYSCSHCAAIDPVLQQVAAALAGQVRVFRVNVVRDGALAADYQVAGTPTLVMFLDGAVVGRKEGPEPTLAAVMEAISQPFPDA